MKPCQDYSPPLPSGEAAIKMRAVLPPSLRPCSGQRIQWGCIWSVIKMGNVLTEFGWHQLQNTQTNELMGLCLPDEIQKRLRNEWEPTEREQRGAKGRDLRIVGQTRGFLLCLVSHQSESGKFKGYFTHQMIQVQELWTPRSHWCCWGGVSGTHQGVPTLGRQAE